MSQPSCLRILIRAFLDEWPSIDLPSLCQTNRVPLDKREGSVKHKLFPGGFEAVELAREAEEQDSGNLTLITRGGRPFEDRSTNHRYGLNFDHDSSMRTSRLVRDARAPNQSCGLACADQGHPRAALDANDLWIRGLGAQHPVESYR